MSSKVCVLADQHRLGKAQSLHCRLEIARIPSTVGIADDLDSHCELERELRNHARRAQAMESWREGFQDAGARLQCIVLQLGQHCVYFEAL